MLDRREIPCGVKDYIPPESYKIKEIENVVLDTFQRWGYHYIITPLLEYLPVYTDGDSGFADDELIKVVERETGRTMVLRADFTPQIARIVNSGMRSGHAPLRLSYSGIVVKHYRNKGKKEIYQAGIELINAKGIGADSEVMNIAGEVLRRVGVDRFVISVSHAGFINTLLRQLELGDRTAPIVELLMQKDYSSVGEIEGLSKKQKTALKLLFELYGDPADVLIKAKKIFKNNKFKIFFNQMEAIIGEIKGSDREVKIILDLREMHSIDYHTGIVFQVFTSGYGEELINGGRYDGFLKKYGTDLPATGLGINISAMMSFLSSRKGKKS
ncbi:MAG: ATP phosphoribosyltransferase regulatory subunit [Deltaproteobacteria bacterium]|nr:ATP phosphoribosyltransferase regulatory subunit [Deltaproteobacteria bacterium]MCL5277401.1 ATP phosphoribosyltransferase regulatory subunit [Deltaproteobacteria bacterium]